MKVLHNMQKYILALLLLLVGTVQASAVTWNDAQNTYEATKGKAVSNPKSLVISNWQLLQCNGYYVKYENGSFVTTKNLPSTNVASDWKPYLFSLTGTSSTTFTSAFGVYFQADGTVGNGWSQTYTLGNGISIKATWGTYYHINQSGAFASSWMTSGGNWTFYPVTLSEPKIEYTVNWTITGTIPAGYSAGVTINGTHYSTATRTIASATVITAAMCSLDDVPGFSESVSVTGNTINITYAEKTTPVLEVENLNLKVGQSSPISLTSTSDAAVTYSVTSGNSLIDFDGTTVVAKNAGTAVIQFSVVETNTYKAASVNCSVAITLNSSDLQFDVTGINLPIGATEKHEAQTFSGSTGGISYSSSAPAIASVSADGTVTALKPGTAVITATLAATAQYAGATASYTVNVVRKTTTIAFPRVTNNNLSLIMGSDVQIGDTFDNAATTNSDGTITYASSNTDVVTVNASGMLTFKGVGNAVITAQVAQTATYQAAEALCYIYVSSIQYYQLDIVDAPARGVLISIAGKSYTSSTLFSSTGTIAASQVSVNAVPCYEVDVDIQYVSSGNSATNPHTITVTYRLVPPQKGRFIRIKSYKYSNYLSADMSSVSGHSGNLGSIANPTLNTVIYYDAAGHFLFYKNGYYANASGSLSPVDVASPAVFSFSAADAVNAGGFAVKSGSLYLRDGQGYVEGDSRSVNGSSDWTVDILTELPVTISNAGYGYATLYCPVALQIPGGISAYVISDRTSSEAANVDYVLTLERLVGVIPAYTPVVLHGMPGVTYDFPLLYNNSDAPTTHLSGFNGTVQTVLTSSHETSGTVFTLQPISGEEAVGFYPWQSSVTGGSYPQTEIQGFRAFIVSASGINGYHFVDSEESGSASALEVIASPSATSAIFNLEGQRVDSSSDALAPGIYIVNGKKIMIRH